MTKASILHSKQNNKIFLYRKVEAFPYRSFCWAMKSLCNSKMWNKRIKEYKKTDLKRQQFSIQTIKIPYHWKTFILNHTFIQQSLVYYSNTNRIDNCQQANSKSKRIVQYASPIILL